MTPIPSGARGSSATNAPVPVYRHTPPSEKAVASMCDDFATQAGWTVDRFEQTRASRICLGLPDRRYHGPRGWRVWVELKQPGGKLTPEQHAWLLAELEAGALALPVDDVAVLIAVHARWRKLYGQADALAYCREVLALVAARGWR
jgi:hypothetical protein